MKRLIIFFGEVIGELKKIQWPKKSEFIFSAIMTLVICFIFSVFFFIVDTSIGYCVKKIITVFI